MKVVVVTPPTDPLIELATAKTYLRVEHDDHDTLIEDHIEACALWLDGPTGVLGIAVRTQTLRTDLCVSSDLDGHELPCGPVQSIDGVTYRNGSNAVVTVGEGGYEVIEATNRVLFIPGEAWPGEVWTPVSVTYVAGYGPDDLPANIRSAALMHLRILYDQPEDKALAALERARDNLLAPIRKRRV